MSLNLVINSWTKAHRVSEECKYMSDSYYRINFHPIILNILARKDTAMIDFIEGEYEDNGEKKSIIMAWICHEIVNGKKVLHYAYTKKSYRRKGYMSKLLKKNGFVKKRNNIVCTFMSYKFKKAMRSSVVFEPIWR